MRETRCPLILSSGNMARIVAIWRFLPAMLGSSRSELFSRLARAFYRPRKPPWLARQRRRVFPATHDQSFLVETGEQKTVLYELVLFYLGKALLRRIASSLLVPICHILRPTEYHVACKSHIVHGFDMIRGNIRRCFPLSVFIADSTAPIRNPETVFRRFVIRVRDCIIAITITASAATNTLIVAVVDAPFIFLLPICLGVLAR